MGFWDFWNNHYFLAWCALWLIWGVFAVLLTAMRLVSRLFRLMMVATRGWPPEHLDADGDWKPEPGDKTA